MEGGEWLRGELNIELSNLPAHPKSLFSLFFDRVFSVVVVGHFTVDFLSGQRTVLLTYFVATLSLSNAALGFVGMIYLLLASLAQPGFGYLADRFGPRWLIVFGLTFTAGFYTVAMLASGTVGLALFLLASIGSAAFHPAATMLSGERSRVLSTKQETAATALFFLFGQSGLFLGPLLAGFILDRSGLSSLSYLALLTIPVVLGSVMWIGDGTKALAVPVEASRSTVERGQQVASAARAGGAYHILILGAFLLLAAFQSWSQQNMIIFLPKYLHELGQSSAVYGFVASLFMGGSAIGNLIGGGMADHFGKRPVISGTLALGSVPIFLVPVIGWSGWLYLFVPLAGAFTGAAFSIIVVLAQRLLPTGTAMASGLILAFVFSSGALGSLLTGHLADLAGFDLVFHGSAGLLIVAALSALLIQE